MHLPRKNNLLIFWRRAKIYISRIRSFAVIKKHINLKIIKIKATDTHSKKIMIHGNIPEIEDWIINSITRCCVQPGREFNSIRSVIFENSKVFVRDWPVLARIRDGRYVQHEGPRHRERSKSRSGAARGAEVEAQGGELTSCLEIPSRCRGRQPGLPKRNEAVIVIHQRIFNPSFSPLS